jgi:hypothetical protein
MTLDDSPYIFNPHHISHDRWPPIDLICRRYPGPDTADEIESQYAIAFIVLQDGTICGERVVKGKNKGIVNQLFKVVRTCHWNPGKCHGRNVPMLYTFSTIIDLQKE